MYSTLLFNLERSNNPNLIAREYALEEEALQEALKRVQLKVEREGLDNTTVGKQQIDEFLSLVADGIATYVEELDDSKARRKPAAYKYIKLVNPKVLTYIVSHNVVASFDSHKIRFQQLAIGIGRAVKNAVEFETLSRTHADVAASAIHRLKYAQSSFKKDRVLAAAYDEATATDFERLSWSEKDLCLIGSCLLSIFERRTGFIEVICVPEARNSTPKIIIPTPRAREWIETSTLREALLSPFFYPMLTAPKPWSDPYNGGYLNPQINKLSLVWSPRKATNRRLENIEMPGVYDAINALQATPWRVNQRVLAVYKALHDADVDAAEIPASAPRELPDNPWTEGASADDVIAWTEANPEEYSSWKRNRATIHTENNKRRSKRANAERKILVGEKFVNEEALYFVYGTDFRGRIYSAGGAGTLNPQGDDGSKALLEFAVGKPIGDSGGFWLAFHVANTWGEDKLSLEDRVQWAVDNTLAIMSYAADPIGNTGWQKADKPFGFLAACFEWAGFMANGEAHISRIPVSLDGSCSGLQHFGAMLRDKQTCESVNVVPKADQSKPSDVYMDVLNGTQRLVAADDSLIAREWDERLSRNIVKQPTMTTPYSVTARGMLKQIQEAVVKATDKGTIEPFSTDAMTAATYLNPHVGDSIREVVSAAGKAMDWLQHVAGITAKAGHPLRWTTPTGFVVTQDYRKSKEQRIALMYNGSRIRVTLSKDTPVINVRRATAGAAANFVHSLDASHLTATVNACHDNGIDSFAMIHDSFASHPSDTPELWAITRITFADQYSGDVLQAFYQEVLDQVPEEVALTIDPPPLQGDLDLDAVLDSEYFFA